MIRRTFLLLTTLLLFVLHCLAVPATASSVSLSWPDGQKAITLTPETAAHYRKLAAQAFANAPEEVRAAQLSLEERAAFTLQLSDEERSFTTLWGLPAPEHITQEHALLTACAVLQAELQLSDEQLVQLFPVSTFEVTDPDTPLWCISFLPTQGGVIRTVKLYAESGCAAELTVTGAVG